MSFEAAMIRKGEFDAFQRRASGQRRKLPSVVVDYLKDAQRWARSCGETRIRGLGCCAPHALKGQSRALPQSQRLPIASRLDLPVPDHTTLSRRSADPTIEGVDCNAAGRPMGQRGERVLKG